MIDIENEVFALIANKLRSELGADKINVTGEYVAVPPYFPCASIVEIGNGVYRRTQDSGSNENHANVFYEVNVYSNKKTGRKQECKKIAQLIDEKMAQLGFTRTMKSPVQNEDPTIYRIVTRYRAVVGVDKTIYRR